MIFIFRIPSSLHRWTLLAATALLWCSCATSGGRGGLDRPAEIQMHSDTSHGEAIRVSLRLQDGREIPMLLDTGCDTVVLDQSYEPLLGRRLGLGASRLPAYGALAAGVYEAPPLYLGNTRLRTGPYVNTIDFSRISLASKGIRGLLGMGCLKYYCVQLDFQANRIRFLDPGTIDKHSLGTPFDLVGPSDLSRVSIRENLAGVNGFQSVVDTGDSLDGALLPDLFQRVIAEKNAAVVNTGKLGFGIPFTAAYLLKAKIGDETYRDLRIHESSAANMLGLRFLERHLVTFDFPHRKMYLKRIETGASMRDFPGLVPVR
ncbi:MAG TPA: hypothetical protein VMF06_18085 [Candidatus Limnocylindria bacterium]|jgi:hypothetical protein|nr:hypothetical protein [Candidatus Limnocylindria bacterium]